jgi:hypothetical protein
MPIRRRLSVFGLLAVLPVLASAQQPKLVNCRTLEAAGNFVGPDEVIVDDMVCQKAKPGANATFKVQAPQPLAGALISEAPAESIVEAAKAAEKRVAVRREQESAKNADAATAAAETVPALSSAASAEAPASPVGTTPTEATPEASAAKAAEPIAAPAPAATSASSAPEPAPGATTPAVQPASQPVAAMTEPDKKTVASPGTPSAKAEPAAPAEVSLPAAAPAARVDVVPESTPPVATATESSAPAAEAKSELPAPGEIVISSAPTSAPSPKQAEQTAQGATPPEAAPASAEPAPALAPTPAGAPIAEPAPAPAAEAASAEPAHPATSSGFYDANARKVSANAAPQTNTGFASAAQVNAGLTPGASSIPTATQPADGGPVAITEPEPQHTTIAAARVDFDADRDRSVKLGDFAKPREVSPDPNAEHRTAVDPSDADGFQDRQRPECTKNITLAGLSGEKLVLGVPGWAAKWIEKNEKRMPQTCFSETPMKNARNYLIVFSTPAGQVSKDVGDAALNPTQGGRDAGVGTFTTLYGSTWHYSFDRNVGTTILTQDDADEPHGAPGQVLFATAYTEEGVPVAQRWPGQAKKELKPNEKNSKKLKGEAEAIERISGDLLGQMVDDIEKL